MGEKKEGKDAIIVEKENDEQEELVRQLARVAEKWVDSQPQNVKAQSDAQTAMAAERSKTEIARVNADNKTKQTGMITTAIVTVFGVVAVGTAVVVAITVGQGEIAKQILLSVLPAIATGFGGYGLGKRAAKDDKTDQPR